MSEYCVTAVRYQQQHLTALQCGQCSEPGTWVQEPHEAPADEIVARIEAGDTVHALLRGDGRVEMGPRLKVITSAQGRKTLALDNAPADCLELSDLERF